MRLTDFIESHHDAILAEWDLFARKIWPVAEATPEALRDHAAEILRAAARDMRTDQTAAQQTKKSEGAGESGASSAVLNRASLDHARGRATSGFSLPVVVAEYRALRATVIRLWSESGPSPHHHDLNDLTRFNETIDQSLAEAVRGYTLHVDRARRMFLAILAHDLRNPLNAMMLSAEALAAASPRGSDVAEIAGQLNASGNAMSKMLTDFLDFAQTQLGRAIPLSPVRADLGRLCNETVAEIRAAYASRTIQVITQGDLSGEWDPERLRQLVSNLVGNAVQHGAAQGAVEVSASGEDDEVRLTVSNGGAPIPPDQLARIFEPLTRGTSPDARRNTRTGSMGLGLYIAREVVVAHGGTISVESTPGRTRFSVTLPRQTPTQGSESRSHNDPQSRDATSDVCERMPAGGALART